MNKHSRIPRRSNCLYSIREFDGNIILQPYQKPLDWQMDAISSFYKAEELAVDTSAGKPATGKSVCGCSNVDAS